MKNLLQHIDSFDKLEDLPSRSNIPLGGGHWGRRKGRHYPWKKVWRFLESRVGYNWDDVFSEFVHLEWIKDEDKTKENIGRVVELNTFLKDGKVWYMDDGYQAGEKPIENCGGYGGGGVFYIHPTTKVLCFYKKTNKENYKIRQKREEAKYFRVLGNYHQLVKIDGIWFEVKGEPVESDIVVVDGLHYKKLSKIPQPIKHYMFNGSIIYSPPPKYKIINGMILTPTIGPKDLMIKTEKPTSTNYWERQNYDSIKITLCRQLNHKDLKKYGVNNDVKPILGKICPVCGNTNCIQSHNNRCPSCGLRYCRNHLKIDERGNSYYAK